MGTCISEVWKVTEASVLHEAGWSQHRMGSGQQVCCWRIKKACPRMQGNMLVCSPVFLQNTSVVWGQLSFFLGHVLAVSVSFVISPQILGSRGPNSSGEAEERHCLYCQFCGRDVPLEAVSWDMSSAEESLQSSCLFLDGQSWLISKPVFPMPFAWRHIWLNR